MQKTVQVSLNGKTEQVFLRMWSRKTRDMLERKYGIQGSNYLSGIIGALATGQARGPTLELVKNLLEKETAKINASGADYDAEVIRAVIFRMEDGGESYHEFVIEELMALPDNEFEKLRLLAAEFLGGVEDRISELRAAVSQAYPPEEAEKMLKLIDRVMSGEATRKN